MITLIPNSGVQFITKEVNLSDDKLNKFRPFEYYEEKDEEEEDEDVFLFKLPYYLSRISRRLQASREIRLSMPRLSMLRHGRLWTRRRFWIE